MLQRPILLGAASCEHGNRYGGKGLSFFKNSSGRNSNIWIYNFMYLIDLSLKNVRPVHQDRAMSSTFLSDKSVRVKQLYPNI